MKRFLSQIAVGALVTFTLFFTAWFLFSAVSVAIGFFQNASDSVKAASITAIVSVVIFTLGKAFESSRERRSKIIDTKIAIYKSFFDFYFDFLHYEKIHGHPKPQEEIMKEMLELQKQLFFWAPDNVVREYIKFKEDSINFSKTRVVAGAIKSDTIDSLAKLYRQVAKLLVAMRRDVGYSFTSLNARDLGSLQLANDADTRKLLDRL